MIQEGRSPDTSGRPAGRLLAIAMVAAAAGLALAGCTEGPGGPEGPEHFLLRPDDVPSGLHSCRPGAQATQDGIETNPTQVPAEELEQFAGIAAGHGHPVDGWFQLLTPREAAVCEDADPARSVTLIVLEWSSADELERTFEEVREGPCRSDQGVYYAGAHLVIVEAWGEDGAVEQVKRTVLKKNRDLDPIC